MCLLGVGVTFLEVDMGLRIMTNVQSIAAQRQLGINGANQKQSLEHLASGSRINKAADDAAGLAISEKMRGMLRSIHQDVKKCQRWYFDDSDG